MRTISPKSIEKLDKLLRRSKSASSLGDIAKKLGVTYPTAKRWFEEWSKEHDYETGYVRQGSRGPEAFVVRAL